MATEIVHWCDVHLARDVRSPVVARHTLTLDGASLVVELCELCEVEAFKPFAAWVTEHGVPERAAGKPAKSAKPAKGAAPARVVAADLDGRTLIEPPPSTGGNPNTDLAMYPCLVCDGVVQGRSPFDRHLRDAHGTSPRALYGVACPACAHECANITGLAAHGQGAHGVRGMFALFDLARREGDPHGIVAARLAGVPGA